MLFAHIPLYFVSSSVLVLDWDEAETEMGAIKKDVKDGIKTTEQDINLVQKNVSAVSGSYGSTGK